MIDPVPGEESTHDQRVLRVRFAADPASVPGARRFVTDGLRAWGMEDLVDDAALCVSELAGNAALHGGSSYIEVGVRAFDRAVRVFVEDDGPVPAAAVAPRTSFPVASLAGDGDETVVPHGSGTRAGTDDLDELELMLVDQPATGRGLAIVSVLASDWGVEALENGKRVWADLGTADDSPAPGAPRRTGTGTAPSLLPGSGEALPPGWALVRLAGCPVELSLRQDQHLDELVRELTLIATDRDNAASADLARRLEAILRAPAHARLAGRRQAEMARQRGERLVDVEMAIPREFSGEVLLLQAAVSEADVLCDQQRLLTLASPQDMRDFRAWMTEEIVGQVQRGARPVTWDAWRSRRGTSV